MKDYFESLIVEQVNRALVLKNLIHYPLKYPELTGLAQRSTSILDEQIETLNMLRAELRRREEDDIRDIFREVRRSGEFISAVEYYGISALYYQTPEIGFLNKLVFKIHQEISLPFPPPSVCCTGTTHYFSHPFTNVIFTPITESEFLLHMPDLYHEIGHCVLENMKSELRMKGLSDNYELAFSRITEHYNELLRDKRREFGPEQISMVIERVHSHWKSWIIEFFCDLFALYTVGPAYAWSHLHLTMKRFVDIHELSLLEQTHPSDESRMRTLLYGLKILGFDEQADKISSRWAEVTRFWSSKPPEYQYAYPDKLLKDIAQMTLNGLKESGISIAVSDALSANASGIRVLLNRAWKEFWDSKPDDFRNWEKERIGELRATLQMPVAQLAAR